MNDNFYQSLIKESSLAYAYHKIILDENGVPYDYEFIEVNDAFGKILGKNAADIMGKTLTEVFPEIRSDTTDWVKIYSEVALDGKKLEIKRYSSVLDTWYLIKAYSPEKYYFICQFQDISKEITYINDLEEFFSINSDLFCITDHDGNFLNTNEQWEHILGYKAEDFKNRNILDFVHPEDFELTRKVFSSSGKNNTVFNFENRYLYKKRSSGFRHFEWRVKKTSNLFYALARDITDTINENNDLDKLISYSEDFLKTSFENIDYQKITDNILFLSGGKYALFNMYEENGINFKTIAASSVQDDVSDVSIGADILNQTWHGNSANIIKTDAKSVTVFTDMLDITENILPKPIISIVKRMFNIGQVVIVKIKKENIVVGDFIIFMKKGDKFNKESLIEIYARNVGLLINRIEADEKIKELLNENNLIFNSTQDALFLVLVNPGPQYTYIRTNIAYRKKTGFMENDVIGKSPVEVFGPMTGNKLFNDYTKCIEGGVPVSYEETINMPIGVRTWATSLTPVYSKDRRPLYIVGSREDITEQKNAEARIKESLDYKEKLLDLVNQNTDSVDEFLNLAVKLATSFTKSQNGYLFLYNEGANGFLLRSHTDEKNRLALINEGNSLFSKDTAIIEQVLKSKKHIIINDFQFSVYKSTYPFTLVQISRLLLVPFINQGTITAFICLTDKEENYDNTDILNLNLLMTNIWTVLERKKSEALLKKEKELFKTTLLSINDAIAATDQNGNITILNEVAQKFTEYSQNQAYGRPFYEIFDIILEDTMQKYENPIEKVLSTKAAYELPEQLVLISKSGVSRSISGSASPIITEGGETAGAVLAFRDITFEKQKQDSIRYLSYHDQLTGLHNRRYFEEQLIKIDTHENLPITVVMADVNGLKLTNDAFGHALGDQLLKSAANAIKTCCRKQDTVARIGGDEFVMLLPCTTGHEAQKIIERIKIECDKAIIGSIVLSISMGHKTKTSSKTNLNEVFKKAENRMYHQKLLESPYMRSKTIQTISSMLYETHKEEEMHSKNVADICKVFGNALNLPERQINDLVTAGSLHDIGKIALDNKVLTQSEPLNDEQWRDIKRHPEIGYRILSSVSELYEISQYVLTHHEHWDGSGYPKGLKHDEIPLQSRIIALADSYDIMTNPSYKKPLSKQEAIWQIQKNSGKQFDPYLASLFIDKVLNKNLI